MSKFIIYKDAACTQVCATIPIGKCAIVGNPDIYTIDAESGKRYIATAAGSIRLLSVADMSGSGGVIPDLPDGELVNTFFDGGTISQMRYRSRDEYSSIYNVFVGASSVSGGAADVGGFGVYLAEYAGEQWYIIIPCYAGYTGNSQYLACCISAQCVGKKSIKGAYDDESGGLNDNDGNSWGGTGTNDRSSDNVGASPHISGVAPFNLAAGRGQHIYILDGGAFDTFTGYLWGSDNSIFTSLWDKWKNLRYNPIGAIIGCHCLPTAFTPVGTAVGSVYLAGTTLSPMPSPPAVCQAVTAANGHIIQYPADGNPVFMDVGGLIDFTDFTGVSITVHVPFCGSCPVPVSACMGGVGADGEYHAGGLAVTYRCDIITGNVCAFVYARDRNGNAQIVQTLTGNCAYQIPVTGNDNGTGQMLGALTSTAVGALFGNPGAVISGIVGAASAEHRTNIVGNHGGSAAILTNLYCWAEFTYNEYSRPANTNPTRGRPSDIGGTVNAGAGIEYSGYTVFDSVDVHEIATLVATDAEKAEIETLLTSGVYL